MFLYALIPSMIAVEDPDLREASLNCGKRLHFCITASKNATEETLPERKRLGAAVEN
jgi:hypothetical protein